MLFINTILFFHALFISHGVAEAERPFRPVGRTPLPGAAGNLLEKEDQRSGNGKRNVKAGRMRLGFFHCWSCHRLFRRRLIKYI